MKGALNFLMTKSFDGTAFSEPRCLGQAGQGFAGRDKKIHTATGKLNLHKGPQPAFEKMPDV